MKNNFKGNHFVASVFSLIVSFMLHAQKDSLFFKNSLSIDFGGNSYSFYRINEPCRTSACYFNVAYQHNFKLQKINWMLISARGGIGFGNSFLFTTNTKKEIVGLPVEASALFGKLKFKPEIAIGYCPVIGKQEIPQHKMPDRIVFDPNLVYSSVNYYDYFAMHLGLAFVPTKKYLPFVCVNWSPVIIPPKNPLPFDSSSYMKGRILMKWFGLTVGSSF